MNINEGFMIISKTKLLTIIRDNIKCFSHKISCKTVSVVLTFTKGVLIKQQLNFHLPLEYMAIF